MAKTCVGIDIGTSRLKMAVCSDGAINRLVSEDMPDNLVRDGRIVSPEAMSDFIKKAASKTKVNVRNSAVILPASVAFTRTMTLPVMTREHLELNLPYEFRDFITQEKDKYFYDYALLDTICNENGKPQEYELIAAASLKETVRSYSDMCRKAGFKLITAVPEEISYMNIIRRFEKKRAISDSHEYCFIDLGHTATRMHIYKGVKLQATRVMELGARMLDAAIAERYGIDEHIASARKHANANDELYDEACMSVYSQISIEIMRAINFYRFNSPDSNLEEVYLCGGGSRVEPLINQLASDIDIPIYKVDDLLPKSGGNEEITVCPAAIGVTMQ